METMGKRNFLDSTSSKTEKLNILITKLNQLSADGDENVDKHVQALQIGAYCDNSKYHQVRYNNGLKSLMSLLRSPKYHYLHDIILEIFTYFLIYDYSWNTLLELDLLTVLTDKMSEYLTTARKREDSIEKMNPASLHHFIILLDKVSRMPTLAGQYCIDLFPFLTAIATDKENSEAQAAEKVLVNLASNSLCFKTLIKFQFPRELRLRNRLLSALKTNYRISTIESILLSSGNNNQEEKQLVAMWLPYVICIKSDWKIVFLKFKGLDLLIDGSLNSSSDKMRMGCLISLAELCSKLKLKCEISSIDNDIFCISTDDDVLNDVCFVLDSGETVFSNRLMLVKSSDVFAAMLTGHFKEAAEARVKFGNASKECFSFVLHYLHGCVSDSCCILRNLNDNLLIDVGAVADRLLLVSLKENVYVEFKRRFRLGQVLSEDIVVGIYELTKRHNYDILEASVLDYALGRSLKREEKYRFFYRIFSGVYFGQELLLDIKKRITEYLQDISKKHSDFCGKEV